MKCLLFVLFFATLSNNLLSQKRIIITASPNTQTSDATETAITCANQDLVPCNLFRNNTFNAPGYSDLNYDMFVSPFNPNYLGVDGWQISHGTPQLQDHPPLIFPATSPVPSPGPIPNIHYASMFANCANDIYLQNYGEGLVQNIPKLIPGHKYLLTFYKKFSVYGNTLPTPPNMDKFYMVMMHCSQGGLINPTSNPYPADYYTPNIPTSSQVVYSENNVSNTGWQIVSVCFTATQDWDLFWMFPRQVENNGVDLGQGKVDIALPELYDATDFTIHVTLQTQNRCNKILTPGCTIANGSYQWKVNGSVVSTASSFTVNSSILTSPQQITLVTSIAGAVNNDNCSFETTTWINPCSCDGNAPVITPGGPIDYYIPLDWTLLGGAKLSSSISSGNQWYCNGQPITGEINRNLIFASQHSYNSGSYYTIVNGCISNVVKINFYYYGYGLYGEEYYALGAKIFPTGSSTFLCSNSTNNFIKQFDQGLSANYSWIVGPGSLGSTVSITSGSTGLHSDVAGVDIGPPVPGAIFFGANYIQGISDVAGKQKIIDFVFYVTPDSGGPYYVCAGQSVNIYASTNFSSYVPPGSTKFDWETYDFGPNSHIINPNPLSYPDPSDPTNVHKLRIPGKGSYSSGIQVSFNAPSVIHNYFYYNSLDGCYKEDFTVSAASSGCLKTISFPKKINNVDGLTIYPNPAKTEVTIKSEVVIQSVEIADLFNSVSKKVAGSFQKMINISLNGLRPGTYNCKIVTTEGIQYKKLIINR